VSGVRDDPSILQVEKICAVRAAPAAAHQRPFKNENQI